LGTPCPAGKTSTAACWLGQAAHTDLPGFKNLEGLAKPEGRPDGRAAYRLPENGRLLNVCSRSKDTAAALWGGWKMSEEGSAGKTFKAARWLGQNLVLRFSLELH